MTDDDFIDNNFYDELLDELSSASDEKEAIAILQKWTDTQLKNANVGDELRRKLIDAVTPETNES